MSRGLCVAAGLAMAGCSDLDYRPGDWEVDVVSALPPAAETMRICVEGNGVSSVGAGNGRVEVRGLRPENTRVRIEVYDLDEVGLLATEWAELGDDTPFAEVAPVELGASPCSSVGAYAAAGEEDRLLVARFVVE